MPPTLDEIIKHKRREVAESRQCMPLEAIQESIGDIGRFLGEFTSLLVKYVVSGTLEDPKISIAPLGIGS